MYFTSVKHFHLHENISYRKEIIRFFLIVENVARNLKSENGVFLKFFKQVYNSAQRGHFREADHPADKHEVMHGKYIG